MCIVICTLLLSRPARGAWVEIKATVEDLQDELASRPARGAWVEINKGLIYSNMGMSRPARGAWVEIKYFQLTPFQDGVAPRKGRVG